MVQRTLESSMAPKEGYVLDRVTGKPIDGRKWNELLSTGRENYLSKCLRQIRGLAIEDA